MTVVVFIYMLPPQVANGGVLNIVSKEKRNLYLWVLIQK